MLKISENTFFCVIAELLLERNVDEWLLLLGEVLNREETCTCEILKGFIALIDLIDLFVDFTETQAIANDERVCIIILGQVMMGILEVFYQSGIEET